jgi:hypothetical protein
VVTVSNAVGAGEALSVNDLATRYGIDVSS